MSRRKDSLRTCSVDGCEKPAFKRGYCADHHRATYGNGTSSSSSSNGKVSSKLGAAALFDAAQVGCDDMILLSSPSEKTITENLQMRHKKDMIYTYIGHVLVSVNPFKQIKNLYTQETIKSYSHKAIHENPPHVFALAEMAYTTMKAEEENQCVIISGESGAGKTEAAKQIMNYISAVSGGGAGADAIKSMILESNPLLEALGNAKTIRNNNSSRFGKYFEIRFDVAGVPRSGYITNYLLEKSRIVFQNKEERSFHIFYQLVKGAPAAAKEKYHFTSKGCSEFFYLSSSGSMTHSIDDVNDEEEFEATRHAMKVTGFGSKEQEAVFSLIAGVLHLGNLKFKEDEKTGACKMSSPAIAAELLGIEPDLLTRIITLRHIKTGKEEYDVPNNAVQCAQARDAIAKALYSRMFDWVVKRVNGAIANEDAEMPYSIGVLDIYGFEVFQTNGFEQFCINFVNEKLQQIFIELTLKNEQEEYAREGIEWKPIKFFDNKTVCQLIEGSLTPAVRLPPGIFSLLDDICATMHAESTGADKAFSDKVLSIHGSHHHLANAGSKTGFLIKHYAGEVEYAARDFPEKNADAVGNDLILAMQSSTKRLIPILFPEEVDLSSKKKPPTSGFKIRNQTKDLVAHLMAANPHYIRTIKSNDFKAPNRFDFGRVEFQVKYLGLLENLRVRRAGFAYRREFHDFLKRFAILSSKTWPNEYAGSDKDGCKAILSSIKKMRPDYLTKEAVQLGKTMLFIKDPEMLHEFDQLKYERLSEMVVKFQRCWREYRKNKEVVAMKKQVAMFLYKAQKERRRESFYRPYSGIYVQGWRKDTELMQLLSHYEPNDNIQMVFLDWVSLVNMNASSPWANLQEKFPTLFEGFRALNQQHPNWKYQENILLAITKENIFIIQQQMGQTFNPASPSAASPRGRSKTTMGSPSSSSSSPPARAASPTGKAAAAASAAYVPTYFLRRIIPLTFLSHIGMTMLADTFLSLHISPSSRLPQLNAPAWRPDKEVDQCKECGERFGLFTRKHHCRFCGDIFCWQCTQRAVFIPDYNLLSLKEPARICSFCFGRESADFMQDVLIASEKRTEIMVLLQDLFKKSPLKSIEVKFSDTLSLNLREHVPSNPNPTFVVREVTVKKSNKSSSSSRTFGDDFTIHSDAKSEVKIPAGLPPDFVKMSQKRMEKRRAAAEARKEAEREQRQIRSAERDRQREIERKQRLAEKKAAKAAAKAAAADEASRTASSGSASSRSKVAHRAAPVVPAAEATPACSTCGCTNFVANMFKKGSCNSCYHKH